jgi:hypothetical protein
MMGREWTNYQETRKTLPISLLRFRNLHKINIME